jgi:hypothetical protein
MTLYRRLRRNALAADLNLPVDYSAAAESESIP